MFDNIEQASTFWKEFWEGKQLDYYDLMEGTQRGSRVGCSGMEGRGRGEGGKGGGWSRELDINMSNIVGSKGTEVLQKMQKAVI